jgi:hypothetical protein
MFHVALCGEFLLGDGLQKLDVLQTFVCRLYQAIISHLWLYIAVATAQDGAVLSICDDQNCAHLV